MTAAALLLAAAVLLTNGPTSIRRIAGGARTRRSRSTACRAETFSQSDPFAESSALDVLAVCLATGMTVPAAAGATSAFAPAGLAALLRRAADLLALGCDPDTAWKSQPADTADEGAALARLARRSASSGSALADGVAELAEQQRSDAGHAAAASAERAGVLIAGPLGLCFLPAFILLGIVPVVAGLAGEIFGTVLR